MEPIEFPIDFSEFLKLLNAHRVEFLLIGGLAVSHHGYPRSTADMEAQHDFVTATALTTIRKVDAKPEQEERGVTA
jgi:hypothetical protein